MVEPSLKQSRIVLARPAHFSAVGELLVQVFVGENYAPADLVPKLRDVASVACTSKLFVAERMGVIVGCVALARYGEPEAEIARAAEAELRMLAVATSARRYRMGESLVRRCIQTAESWNLERLVLSTDPRMEAAERLYTRLGFSREPARDWTKPDGRRRLAYVLQLSNARTRKGGPLP
jgi:N-acetylglutamate synthase-like GNAT family acetyltransferase